MSSPPAITAFEFSHHRRESKDSHSSEPPRSISQVTESDQGQSTKRESDDDRRKYDDFDDYVPVNVTDGDGEARGAEEDQEPLGRRLMEDLTWAFECR